MAESARQKRMRELGLLDSGIQTESPQQAAQPVASGISARQKRMMDLGITQAQPVVDTPSYVTNVENQDQLESQFRQENNDAASMLQQQSLQDTDAAFRKENKPLPGRHLPVIGPVLQGLDIIASNPFSEATAEHTVPDQPMFQDGEIMPGTSARTNFMQNSGQVEATGASKFIGQAVAPFFVPGLGIGTGSVIRNSADTLTSRLAPGLGQNVAREAAIGGAIGFGSEYAQGQGDLTNAAISGAAGAVLGGALPLLGRGIGAASQAAGRDLTQATDKPALGNAVNDFIRRVNATDAPAPTGRIAQEIPRPIYSAADQAAETFKRIESPTTARIEPKNNYYADRLDELFNAARQEQLSPGREREVLDDLWSRMAGPHDPSLDRLIELGTPTLKQLERTTPSKDMLSRARLQQSQKEVAGVPLPVKSELDRGLRLSSTARGELQPAPQQSLREPAQAIVRDVQPVQRQPLLNNEEFLPRSASAPESGGAVDLMAGEKPRGFTETLINSDKTAPGLREKLKSAYTPITNETSVAQANKRINKDLESAASYVVSKSPLSAEKVTTAHRVIDEFSKSGNYERANDIADKIAAELTKAGQSIQAASIYNRLTPEGILVHANRLAQRINEKLPVTAKEVKVTTDMAAQITDLAQTTQRMTGVKDLSNDVMNILEKAKTGEKLTDTEATTLKNFVNESKQFIKETTRKPRDPRPPQEPQDKRVRDNVVSFLDAQEAAAKERLRARGIQISSTPLDVWADYAVIGAAKLGKGTIKFADWSEAMVKDLGESIRPQLQQLYEHSVQAYNQSKNVVTKQTISDAEKLAEKVVANKEITGPQADSIRSLAQKVSRLSGDEKITASQDLQQILQTLERPGILKKISSTQTIGQLLNPKTQVRNAVGNELFYRVERLNKMVATPIDIVRSKITGGERTVTFKTNNQGEYWKNWMRGAKAGWKGVNINGLQTAYDLGSPAFSGKFNPLTYMEKALGASLKSFDTAAYMRAYNNTVGELSTLRALNEGKRGDKDLIAKYIREADDNVMKIADEYGRYVTFQDNNAISKGLVATKRGLNLGKDFGLGDLVLKYPKTPGAILMRALEYSPAGFLRSASIMARPWFKKEPNTKEATEALTRAMIGTFGFSGLGYFLMDKGIVTGSASKDKDVRDLQKTAGQGQYQVNLSALSRFVQSGFDLSSTKLQEGDQMYTYDWMQPVSIAASMGANVAKNMREGKSKLEGLAGTAYNSVEGGLSTLTEQSVLSGLKSATQLYPGQTVADKIADIITDIPSSFIPTYLNQAKQLTDNTKPETFSPDKIERGLNKAQAKIPGLAGNLPKQFSSLGEKKEVYQDNNAFNVLFNPGFSSNYKLSPEAKYVVDLMNESGDESVAPRVPGKTISVNGHSMQLNGDQFSRLQELQGQEQNNRISKLKGTGSLENRVKNAQDALTKAGTDARKQLVKEYPELNPPKAAK